MQSKSGLRRGAIARRDDLSSHKIRRLSAAASSHLFGLPELKSARTVMFFVSFGSEVDTLPMIRRALADGKRVAAPAADRSRRQLTPRQVRDTTADLAPGAHGIREPKKRCQRVGLDEIDVVIVPAAVWSEDGYRIGYGGGYYDRFLARVPHASRIGLGFETQVVNTVPHGPHDLPVHVLVTEAGVRRLRRVPEGNGEKASRRGRNGERSDKAL